MDPSLGPDQSINEKKTSTTKMRSPSGLTDYENEGFSSKLKKEIAVGGAIFIQQSPPLPDPLPSLVSKRVNLLSKLPKLAPFVEKSEKFQEFIKRLCNN